MTLELRVLTSVHKNLSETKPFLYQTSLQTAHFVLTVQEWCVTFSFTSPGSARDNSR